MLVLANGRDWNALCSCRRVERGARGAMSMDLRRRLFPLSLPLDFAHAFYIPATERTDRPASSR